MSLSAGSRSGQVAATDRAHPGEEKWTSLSRTLAGRRQAARKRLADVRWGAFENPATLRRLPRSLLPDPIRSTLRTETGIIDPDPHGRSMGV